MQTLLWTLIIIATLGAASYFRMKLMNATIAVAIAMLLGSIFGPVGGIAWLVFLIIAIPLNVESLRKKYLTAPILDTYKKIMPEMSSTERDAIDAGTVWWDGEIFSGNPNWQALHSIPQARLSAEEREFLDGPVAQVCQMVNDWDITHKDTDLTPEVGSSSKTINFSR